MRLGPFENTRLQSRICKLFDDLSKRACDTPTGELLCAAMSSFLRLHPIHLDRFRSKSVPYKISKPDKTPQPETSSTLNPASLYFFKSIVLAFKREPKFWFEVHKTEQSSVLAFIFVHLTSPFMEARASALQLADTLSSLEDLRLSPGFPLCLSPAPDMAMSARYALR